MILAVKCVLKEEFAQNVPQMLIISTNQPRSAKLAGSLFHIAKHAKMKPTASAVTAIFIMQIQRVNVCFATVLHSWMDALPVLIRRLASIAWLGLTFC